MAQIAIFHPTFIPMGGAESVAMNAISALQDRHETTLVTMNYPGIDVLNEYYGTQVTPLPVCRVPPIGKVLSRTNIPSRFELSRLRKEAFRRSFDADKYDIIFSTQNEYNLGEDSIQYIHYPSNPKSAGSFHRFIYNYIWKKLGNHKLKQIQESTLLANSKWTADITSDVYRKRPHVVYPPIDTQDLVTNTLPWKDRENGFVSIGYVRPSKNIINNIDIVTKLRKQGYDVHLHIIGPIEDTKYGDSVISTASESDGIFIEGKVTRKELVDYVTSHKYGLHGKINEHFGMAVAELSAGGALPFVHNSGGQREIVGEQAELTYDNTLNAADTIQSVLRRDDGGRSLREDLPDVEKKFGKSRFKSQIREIIEEKLEELEYSRG